MWILSLNTLESQKIVFNGTLESCLIKALELNASETRAYTGCYMDTQQYDFVPDERNR
jgi:hypothetical protein